MTTSDAVSRLNAALEGRYAIERELGEGGMAGDVSEPERFILVTNWFEELRERMAN